MMDATRRPVAASAVVRPAPAPRPAPVVVIDGRAYAARRVSRHEAMRRDVRRWERWS